MIEGVVNFLCGEDFNLPAFCYKSVRKRVSKNACESASDCVCKSVDISFCKSIRVGIAFLCLLLSFLFTSVAVAAEDAVINSKGNLVLGIASIPEFMGSDEQQAVPLIISNFSFGEVNGVFEGGICHALH